MINTCVQDFKEKYRFNQHPPKTRFYSNNINKFSTLLNEPINMKKNIYCRRNRNTYYEHPSFELDDNMTKTQPNFYHKYIYYKSKSYLYPNSCIAENSIDKNLKEGKELRILNHNYKEIYNDIMEKNIKTYPFGIILNISNIETQKPLNIPNDNNPKRKEDSNKRKEKRIFCSKSFSDLKSKKTKNNISKKNKSNIIPLRNRDKKENCSFDSQNRNYHYNHPKHEYNKTCANFFRDNDENKIQFNINNEYRRYSSIGFEKKYVKKILLFIDKLENFFIQTINQFFSFFIHRTKLVIKFKCVGNLLDNSQLIEKQQNKSKIYRKTFTKNINNSIKTNIISKSKSFDPEKKNKFLIKNSKNENISLNTNLKDKIKKHVQFEQVYSKTKSSEALKNSGNENYSKMNSNINLSTAFNSNGLKSTNSKSTLGISNNISNISLTPNKVNKDLSYDIDSKLLRKMNSFNMYSNNKAFIYVKPVLEKSKIFKTEKKQNKININNKFESSSIKSIIIKKKNAISSIKKKEIKDKEKLKEIVIKDIQSKDKRINISIKYVISEKVLMHFKKESIRKKVLNFKISKNIFLNNDIELLKPMTIESFDLGPVITIIKTNIKNNDININKSKNKEKNENLLNIINIMNNLYNKYITYFKELFFLSLKNNYNSLSLGNISKKNNELNIINISSISNKLNENTENEIIVEENYSLNNDIENNLISNNDKIEPVKYMSEIGYIDKMISSNDSEKSGKNNFKQRINTSPNEEVKFIDEEKILGINNNVIEETDNNNYVKKLQKWNYGSLDEKKLFRTKISRFKVCKSILKNLGIKINKKEDEKEKDETIKKILDKIEFNNNLKLLKKNLHKWKQNILKNNLEKNIPSSRHSKKNDILNLIKGEEIREREGEILSNHSRKSNRSKKYNKFSIKHKFDSIYDEEIDTIAYEEILNDFRLYLISYSIFGIKNNTFSDD